MPEIKTITKNKPMPGPIKKAIRDKQEWIKKVQSGEIKIDKTRIKQIG